jgi:hypothetical protein
LESSNSAPKCASARSNEVVTAILVHTISFSVAILRSNSAQDGTTLASNLVQFLTQLGDIS